MKQIKVIMQDDNFFYTRINGTETSIKEYYYNNSFNMGGMCYDYETDTETEVDNMQRVKEVIFL